MKLKNLIILIISILIYSNLNCQIVGIPNSHVYPLKSIEEYCQKDTQKLIQKTTLKYNDENQLIEGNMEAIERKTKVRYQYDEYGQLESKEFMNANTNTNANNKIYLEYDSLGRVVFQGVYDYMSDKKEGTTYKYEANHDKPIEMIREHGMNKSVYKYEYNSNQQIEYQYLNDELIGEYIYEGDLVSRQITYSNETKILTYEYNSDNKIVKFYSNGELMRENIYSNGLLVQKWINSNKEIEPCKHECCGRMYKKYEYF